MEVNDEKETNQKNKGQNHALSFVFCPLVFCLGLFLSFTLSPDNRCETREVTARKGSVTAAVWCNEGEVNGRKKRASFVHSFITFFCSISLLTSSPVIGPQSTGVSQGVFCCCCAYILHYIPFHSFCVPFHSISCFVHNKIPIFISEQIRMEME